MKFQSPIISKASGSIAGITASRNRGGMYLRSRVTPANPNTSNQQFVRGHTGTIATRWSNTLSEAQRASWRVYAMNQPMTNRLGQSRKLPAICHFIRSNWYGLYTGTGFINSAPTIYTLPGFSIISVTADVPNQGIWINLSTSQRWFIFTGNTLIISMSRPKGQTINYWKGPYLFCGRIFSGFDDGPPPYFVFAPYPFTAGKRLFISIRLTMDDGRLTTMQRYQVNT